MHKGKSCAKVISVFLCAVMLFTSLPLSVFSADSSTLDFAVMSGLSYVTPQNRGDYNDAFMLDAKANNLQYDQLDGLLASSFDSIKQKAKDGLKYVLINGDLTYNGEFSGIANTNNTAAVAAKLLELEEETGVNVIVCNGDKDIYNVNASSFATGSRVGMSYTSPDQFSDTFKNLGRDLASSTYKSEGTTSYGNQSYSVDLDGGYKLIVIDAAYYNVSGVLYANGDRSIYGRVTDDVLAWAVSECQKAEKNGQTVIGMCHWDLTGDNLTSGSGVLQNGEYVANVLADAGMHYIYTAGTGKNDISSVISDNGETIYDIQTGSLVSFPNSYRMSHFNGNEGTFTTVDIDDTKNVVSRDGTVYDKPYRETASLKVQYANYDMAQYFADMVQNYMSSTVIPGVKKQGSIENFVQKQYNINLTDYINEMIGGGINILGFAVIFDATNIMNMLEGVFAQIQERFMQDSTTLSEICYESFKKISTASISQKKCTAFLDTYGFGSSTSNGTVNDLLLSVIAYSYNGNEDSSKDVFIKDVRANLETGELTSFLLKTVGECLVGDLLFDRILSQITMQPEYLLFLDDTKDSLGYYLELAFNWYIKIHGESESITGFVNTVLKDGAILGISSISKYGKTINEVVDYYIDANYNATTCKELGAQLSTIIKNYTYDTEPQLMGDYSVTYKYDGKVTVPATTDNYRLPSMITVTPGADTRKQVSISWYTSASVKDTNIEIYSSKDSKFYGNHFIGVDGVSAETSSESVSKTYSQIDLGFVSFGDGTIDLTRHTLKLSGLQAGCTYYYRIGDADKGWWSDTNTITTADGSDNVSFLHVSDTKGSFKSDFDVFDNILGCAEQLYPDTDFVLHTGNFVNNSSNVNQWKQLFDSTSSHLSDVLTVPVAGTKESDDTAITDNYVITSTKDAEQTGVYYSFDYNNVHVAVLDSNELDADGTLTTVQEEWLKKDMNSSSATWKFVAVNKPVYTDGESSQAATYALYRTSMATLMDSLGVDLVFSGNDCIYYRTDCMTADKVTDSPLVTYPNSAGRQVKTIVNPKGTAYSALGSSGSAGYDEHMTYDVSKMFTFAGIEYSKSMPMFTSIVIEDNVLYLETYTVDGYSAHRIESLSLRKDSSIELKGDVNLDGHVTAADARLALRAAAKLQTLSDAARKNADVDGDSVILAKDARLILRVAAKLDNF